MKILKNKNLKYLLLLGVVFTLSCERNFSDNIEFAKYPATGEIFVDGFVGGLDYFPFGDSFAEAFSVDENEAYLGTASMRFDIPAFGVGYGGATFPSTAPRDLSSFDALTFWAKASQGADINEIGFGINGDNNNKFRVTRRNLPLSTVWTKYVIPIPDPSKLSQEKGMFWYAEGAESADDEGGYTFWIDELKFEKLGTVAQPQPAIVNGVDQISQIIVNGTFLIPGLTQTFNLSTGKNVTVSAAPSYFEFSSTDIEVARVSELGVISVVDDGTAKITAILGGVKAKGSVEVTASRVSPAPTPTRDASNVISLFSNAYTNIAGVLIDANYGGQTTKSSELNIAGDHMISYTALNYVGFEFQNPTVDASDYNFLHVDVLTNSSTSANFNIEIRDRGTNGMLNTNTNTGAPSEDDKRLVFSVASNSITQGEWMSFDIPLTGDLASQKGNLAALIFSGDIDFLLDNVYFYK
ncbi:glycosyl hydrolase family 16 [uncultured Polaribacter sp.]|uniref:glycosyl hydrolase family 16 n=1 Tax=uncultured Polaribacter sp. TaxID=174711 RepID=UPI00261DFAA1|nr:glycosyl hydrolase family 16 [uncultured Polaribacter sp.]